MRFFCVLSFSLVLTQLVSIFPGLAASPMIISGDESVDNLLSGHIDFLEDVDGVLKFSEVANSNLFMDTGESTPNFKFTDSTYWFRFSVTNHTQDDFLLLELGYPLLDYVSLFSPKIDGEFTESLHGDMLPFSEKMRNHRTITFELNHLRNKTKTYYLKVQTSSSLQLPLRVYTEKYFAEIASQESSVLGGYYGIILVMIFFNGLLGLSLKDKTYFYYIGFLASYLLVQLSLNGDSHRFLFFTNPKLGNIILPICVFTTGSLAVRFSHRFLVLDRYLPAYKKLFAGVEYFGWVFAILSVFLPYNLIIRIAAPYAGLVAVLIVGLGVVVNRAGFGPAKTYLLAWSCLGIGIVIFVLKTFNFIPTNIFTSYAIQVGSVLEVTLLSLALADRIHVIQREREQALSAEAAAHYSLAESYEALNVELERRQAAEDALSLELRARGHLVAEAAHRLNNPLNVTLGGLGALEQRLSSHVESLQELFLGLEAESNEDKVWLERMKYDLSTMQEASADARVAAGRVGDFLEEFRAVGGVRGAQNHYTKLTSIFERSNRRLRADLGPEILNQVRLLDEVEEISVWSNEYVAGLLLSYSLRDLLSRNLGEVEVRLRRSDTGSKISLEVVVGGSHTTREKSDLVDLSPIQLGAAVGGGTPRVVEARVDGNKFGYTLDFEIQPPATTPSLEVF